MTYTSDALLVAAAKITGPQIPPEFPKKYRQDVKKVDVFNASMSFDLPTLTAWEKRHGIPEMESDPLAIFGEYLRTGHVIFSALVSHPPVPDPDLYSRCSVVLQRAVIVHAGGREDLYLKSQFHSAKDEQHYVNFAPKGALRISFPSEEIWFPLELTRVIQEPTSFVVLDLLTERRLDLKQIPPTVRAGGRGRVSHQGKQYHAVRLSAVLRGKERAPDLKFRPAFRPSLPTAEQRP